MASWCWLLAGGPAPPHMGLSSEMLEHYHDMAAGSPRATDPGEKGRSCDVMGDLASEVTLDISAVSYWLHYCVNPIQRGRGCRRVGSPGTILGADCHKHTSCWMVSPPSGDPHLRVRGYFTPVLLFGQALPPHDLWVIIPGLMLCCQGSSLLS